MHAIICVCVFFVVGAFPVHVHMVCAYMYTCFFFVCVTAGFEMQLPARSANVECAQLAVRSHQLVWQWPTGSASAKP